MTGEKILNYRIENLSEENQLYQSFVATHTLFSKKVVIKNLKPLRSFLEKVNFNEEIKKLSLIQHPNVITLYDQLETASESYLIFEHINGRSIRDHIKKVSGPIPEAKSISYFQKILDAFILIHQKGIIGGAINANNILITEDNNIKVLDLALSQFYQELLLKEADPEALSYTSPEVLSGKTGDQKSDIYALGMLLYHMLTGINPYENLGAETIREKVVNQSLPEPTQFYPVISKGIQAVLKKAMAKDPLDRFPDGRSFRQALLELSPKEKPKGEPMVLINQQSVSTEGKQQSQTDRPADYRFVNVPLFLLIGLVSIMGLMLYSYSQPDANESNLLMEIENTEKIEDLQNSIIKAKREQALKDSIRIFQNINRRDSTTIHYHQVNRGESISSIAKKYYQPLDSVLRLNNFTGKERLKRRQGVKVKVKTIYKVKRNETLASIGQKFKINPFIIKQVNNLYPKPVEPGEKPEPVIFEGKNIVIPLIQRK